MELKKVVVVGGKRIPFVKSFSNYGDASNQDMLVHCLKDLVQSLGLEGKVVGEVALGAVMKNPADWNLAREVTLSSGLAPQTPAFDLQRACGTSLEAAILIANKIKLGQIECGIAGGADTNSDIPLGLTRETSRKFIGLSQSRTWQDRAMALTKFNLNDIKVQLPAVVEPRTGMNMGQHCEKMAQEWGITRAEQDELAAASHLNGANAYEKGFYNDLLTPYKGVTRDKILRPDTSAQKLAKLRPTFERSEKGTLTAGNSTALTDGAAAVFLASEEYAKANNLPILATFVDGQAAANNYVAGEGLLMAPTKAVADLLARHELRLQDFDFYEIHEAFAAQVLCTLKAWEDDKFCREKLGADRALGSIDRAKMNTKGGSVALGHPFAATGARIVAGLGKILEEKGSGRGLISVCTGGGMGVAAILER